MNDAEIIQFPVPAGAAETEPEAAPEPEPAWLVEARARNEEKKRRAAEQRAHDNEVVARQYGLKRGDPNNRRK